MTSASRTPGAARGAADVSARWADIPQIFRQRGMRWTPQRRAVLSALADASGHVTAAQILERCRAHDPSTTPSTVYRTLDVLEELGLIRHGHAADGREEFHVQPSAEHGHRYCSVCGRRWEIADRQADAVRAAFASADGFEIDLSHLTAIGVCGDCARRR